MDRILKRASEALRAASDALAYHLGCTPLEISIDPEVFDDIYRDAHTGHSSIGADTRLAFGIPAESGAYGLTFIRFGSVTLRRGGSEVAKAIAERDRQWLDECVRKCAECKGPATRVVEDGADPRRGLAYCDAHGAGWDVTVDLRGAQLIREAMGRAT